MLPCLTILVVAGCGKKNEFIAPPPPPVTVAVPEVRDVTIYRTFPGTLEGIAAVEVRARVRGMLEKRHFEDGELIEAGEPLFLIEPEPYQAQVSTAEAQLASAEAAFDLAQANRRRMEKALETNAVSANEVDVARAEEAQADAAIKQASAALEAARIDLSYTEIKAPISGRLSRALVDTGNLVGASDSTLLTTIVDDSEVRAYFELNERVILPYLDSRPQPGGNEQLEVSDDLELQLELTDGRVHKGGKIDFIDNRIDEATRTVRVRAVFPNSEGTLAAGLFARVGIPLPVEQAVLIPSLAIQRDLAGEYVWVVGEGDIVRRQGVDAGALLNEQGSELRIIEKGLTGDERVIVAGLQRAREGAEVNPHRADTTPDGEDEPAQGSPEPAREEGSERSE
jgi:RND family efflux transporter MFP subunit